MSGLSNQNEQDFINHNLRPGQTAVVAPVQMNISLHTADPGEDGQLAEVIGGGYSRALITGPAVLFGAPANREIISTDVVTFNSMPAVTVTHVGFWRVTGSTAADFLASDALSPPVAVPAGQPARFPAGSLSVKFNNLHYTNYLAHAWLNFIFRSVAYTRPSGHTHQIYAGDPTGAGTAIGGATPQAIAFGAPAVSCLLYTSPSPRD